MLRGLPWVVLASLAAGVVWLAARPVPGPTPRPGKPLAPTFTLDTLDGGKVHLTQLRGKPVVLNFWASWCGPCRAEMPVLARAWERYGRHVHFLGVNVLDDPEDARRFAAQLAVPFPSAHDPRGDTLRWFQVVGLPSTVFVTAEGTLAKVHPGPFLGEAGERALEREIREVQGR